jgi:endoglucanase
MMKRSYILILIVSSLIFTDPVGAQPSFNRGVNLTGWFQANSPGQIQFTKYGKQDLVNIKSLGCDVIRLPINLHSMISGSPDYILDRLFVSFLDSVVNWAEQINIYLILDNHSFDPNDNTSPTVGTILTKVWTQMAQHYKDRSDYIIYEILNEPHGIAASTWGTIQGQVINAIRLVDTKHTIMVGGVNFNTYTELQNIPVYSDQNLIYTFHFYDPFMFTHQGATWVSPSMQPLSGVPFPFNATEMPACPASLKGTWIESGLNNYPTQGNVSYVKSLIDIAVSFKNSRNVKVFCGEYGVYIQNSDPADRVYWYGVVRQYLEEKGIPWTTWDYQGGFGLYNKGSNQLFDNDLNTTLLGALGFNIPPQTPFVIKPETSGFMIYTDYLGRNVNDASYGSGTTSFYSTEMPNNNSYCIDWSGFSQYNTVGFDFGPDKDFSGLVTGGYALDFMVRGNTPGTKFEIRFVDTKTGTTDHPWRKGFTIDQAVASWDKKWHHVHLMLSSFTERGSWDNGAWYNPEGKFDWTRVDKLEISTEYSVTAGQELWFDNIYITNLDTAVVRESGIVGIVDFRIPGKVNMSVSPNPFTSNTSITYEISKYGNVLLDIFSLTGNRIRQLVNESQPAGTYSLIWDGRGDNGRIAPAGIYIILLSAPEGRSVRKVIKSSEA